MSDYSSDNFEEQRNHSSISDISLSPGRPRPLSKPLSAFEDVSRNSAGNASSGGSNNSSMHERDRASPLSSPSSPSGSSLQQLIAETEHVISSINNSRKRLLAQEPTVPVTSGQKSGESHSMQESSSDGQESRSESQDWQQVEDLRSRVASRKGESDEEQSSVSTNVGNDRELQTEDFGGSWKDGVAKSLSEEIDGSLEVPDVPRGYRREAMERGGGEGRSYSGRSPTLTSTLRLLNHLLLQQGFPAVLENFSSADLEEQGVVPIAELQELIQTAVGVAKGLSVASEQLAQAADGPEALGGRRGLHAQAEEAAEERRLQRRAVAKMEAALAQERLSVRDAEAEADRLKVQLRDHEAAWEVERAKLQRRVTQARHSARSAEAAATKMKGSLEASYSKQDERRVKSEKLFIELHGRARRKASRKDSASLSAISAFEDQRDAMEEELVHLRQEVGNLNASLRDHANDARLGRRVRCGLPTHLRPAPSSGGTSCDSSSRLGVSLDATSNGSLGEENSSSTGCQHCLGYRPSYLDEEEAEPAHVVRERYERRIVKLSHDAREREASLLTDIRVLEHRLQEAVKCNQEVEEELANVRLDLAGRPSLKDWRDKTSELYEVKRQLSESKSVREMRKHMSTRELVQMDKANKRLGLKKVEKLPVEIATEILQGLCRLLELDDVALLTPAVQRMVTLVDTVPGMQKFIRDVCGVVADNLTKADAILVGTGARGKEWHKQDPLRVLDSLLPLLSDWGKRGQRIVHLDGLRGRVVDQLRQRSAERHAHITKEDWLNIDTIVDQINSLVRSEAGLSRAKSAFDAADLLLDTQPDEFLSRFCKHFMELFDVAKGSDGLFPRLNEVYLYVTETNNTLKAMRGLLNLEPSASIKRILFSVKALATGSTAADVPGAALEEQALDYQVGALTKQVASQAVALTRAKETLHACTSLLQLQNEEGIPGTVRKLITRVRMYDQMFPAVDGLVASLYEALKVTNIQDILPAVKKIQRQFHSSTASQPARNAGRNDSASSLDDTTTLNEGSLSHSEILSEAGEEKHDEDRQRRQKLLFKHEERMRQVRAAVVADDTSDLQLDQFLSDSHDISSTS